MLSVWLVVLGTVGFAMPAGASPLLILADASGSMREAVTVPRRDWEGPDAQADPDETVEVPKIAVVRTLLTRLLSALPAETAHLGIFRLRYLAGNLDRYAVFREPAVRDLSETAAQVAEEFPVDYPVFNRRSAIGDGLRQLDERVLSEWEGPRTLLLISDGRESFYDLERDREVWTAGETASEGGDETEMWGPLTETARLRDVYGADLRLVSVYLDREAPDAEEIPEGRRLLTDMADVTGDRLFDGVALLADMAPLADALFGGR